MPAWPRGCLLTPLTAVLGGQAGTAALPSPRQKPGQCQEWSLKAAGLPLAAGWRDHSWALPAAQAAVLSKARCTPSVHTGHGSLEALCSALLRGPGGQGLAPWAWQSPSAGRPPLVAARLVACRQAGHKWTRRRIVRVRHVVKVGMGHADMGSTGQRKSRLWQRRWWRCAEVPKGSLKKEKPWCNT